MCHFRFKMVQEKGKIYSILNLTKIKIYLKRGIIMEFKVFASIKEENTFEKLNQILVATQGYHISSYKVRKTAKSLLDNKYIKEYKTGKWLANHVEKFIETKMKEHDELLFFSIEDFRILENKILEAYSYLEKEILENIDKEGEEWLKESTFTDVWLVTPSRLLSRYYNKQIKLDWGMNSPKLAKQLYKHGIKPTEEELITFGEAFTSLTYIGQATYVYMNGDDEIIPDDKDTWNLAGSCHYTGGVGENTPLYLSEHDFMKMMKGYSCDEDVPTFRFYYAEVDDELGHAGMYFEEYPEWLRPYKTKDDSLKTTSYRLTNLILAGIYEKNLDDFIKTENGLEMPHNVRNIWCNMADDSPYSKWVCSENGDIFLKSFNMKDLSDIEEIGEYWPDYWSDYHETFLDEDDAVYAHNVDDYVSRYDDNVHFCLECRKWFLARQYSYKKEYRDSNSNYFCSRYCLECYYGIEEL